MRYVSYLPALFPGKAALCQLCGLCRRPAPPDHGGEPDPGHQPADAVHRQPDPLLRLLHRLSGLGQKHAEAGVPRPGSHQGAGLLQREPGRSACHCHLRRQQPALLPHQPSGRGRFLCERGSGGHPPGQRAIHHHRLRHLWHPAARLPRRGGCRRDDPGLCDDLHLYSGNFRPHPPSGALLPGAVRRRPGGGPGSLPGAGGPAAPLPAGLSPHRAAGALPAAGGGAQRSGGRPGGHRPQRQGGLCQSDRLPAAPEE